MCKEYILHSLQKIEETLERIISNSENIVTVADYYNTPSGVERLESTCMLLIAIGESIKGIDKTTDKKLLLHYPDMDWKGVMGMRDIIAHHYFDLDGEVVFNVVKFELPNMLQIIRKIIHDVKIDNFQRL